MPFGVGHRATPTFLLMVLAYLGLAQGEVFEEDVARQRNQQREAHGAIMIAASFISSLTVLTTASPSLPTLNRRTV